MDGVAIGNVGGKGGGYVGKMTIFVHPQLTFNTEFLDMTELEKAQIANFFGEGQTVMKSHKLTFIIPNKQILGVAIERY